MGCVNKTIAFGTKWQTNPPNIEFDHIKTFENPRCSYFNLWDCLDGTGMDLTEIPIISDNVVPLPIGMPNKDA